MATAPELFSRPILFIFRFLESRELVLPNFLLFRSFRTTKFVSELDLCRQLGFACVISELVGGLPDLG